MRRNTRKQQYTSAFDKNCLFLVQEDRQEEERQFLSKALVYCCFLQFRRIGEYIFPRAVLLCQTHQQLFTHSLSVLTRG